MFEHFQRFPWVMDTIFYGSDTDLIAKLGGALEGSAGALCQALPLEASPVGAAVGGLSDASHHIPL